VNLPKSKARPEVANGRCIATAFGHGDSGGEIGIGEAVARRELAKADEAQRPTFRAREREKDEQKAEGLAIGHTDRVGAVSEPVGMNSGRMRYATTPRFGPICSAW